MGLIFNGDDNQGYEEEENVTQQHQQRPQYPSSQTQQTQTQSQQAPSVPPINANRVNNLNPELFGKPISGLMSSGHGSEYTRQIASELVEIYQNNAVAREARVNVFDKEHFVNLAYSCIVVSLYKNNVVNYYVILLEETGRKPYTVYNIIQEYNNCLRNGIIMPYIHTADDAINHVLREMIESELALEYGSGLKYVNVDGVVLTEKHPDLDAVIPVLATLAYNACFIDIELGFNSSSDVNLVAVSGNNGTHTVRIETSHVTNITTNEIGNPIRADWRLDLIVASNNNVINRVLNSESTVRTITRTAGFIESVPTYMRLGYPTITGQPQEVVKLIPQIVITSIGTTQPSIGYSLLGVITALTMTDKNMYLGVLKPGVKDNNVGALNILTKIDDGHGERIDFNNKDYLPEDILAALDNMYGGSPMVSMDIESFGPQSAHTSVFASSASGLNNNGINGASKKILETVSQLTNNNFPADFNPKEIFLNEGIIVPLGRYSDKDGMRDIREFDLATLCKHTDDPTIIARWTNTNLPMSTTGNDSFLTRVDILSKFIPSAEITGKALRVTFTTKFLNTLSNTLRSMGFITNYEPIIRVNNMANMAMLGSYFNNAGFSGNLGFATDVGSGLNTYQTVYGYHGTGRFQ